MSWRLSALTVQQVRLALALEEEAALNNASTTAPESSASVFVLTGLDIEKAQVICTKASDMWSFGMVIYVWLYVYILRFTSL